MIYRCVSINNHRIHSITEESATMATEPNVNANPAYEMTTPLQSNIAYESNMLHTRKQDETAELNIPEPEYDVIPPITTTTAVGCV